MKKVNIVLVITAIPFTILSFIVFVYFLCVLAGNELFFFEIPQRVRMGFVPPQWSEDYSDEYFYFVCRDKKTNKLLYKQSLCSIDTCANGYYDKVGNHIEVTSFGFGLGETEPEKVEHIDCVKTTEKYFYKNFPKDTVRNL